MHFYTTVETEESGTYFIVVIASDSYYAERLARKYFEADGEIVVDVTAEMFNTFEHGDYTDYEIVS